MHYHHEIIFLSRPSQPGSEGTSGEQQDLSASGVASHYGSHQPGIDYSLQRQREIYPHMIQSHIQSMYGGICFGKANTSTLI